MNPDKNFFPFFENLANKLKNQAPPNSWGGGKKAQYGMGVRISPAPWSRGLIHEKKGSPE